MEMALEKCRFLSVPQQKIILLMANSGGGTDYKSQTVFKNERSFNIAMRQLVRVKACREIQDRHFYPLYELTENGKWLIRFNIIPLEVKNE